MRGSSQGQLRWSQKGVGLEVRSTQQSNNCPVRVYILDLYYRNTRHSDSSVNVVHDTVMLDQSGQGMSTVQ
jgi:hypothetical protein